MTFSIYALHDADHPDTIRYVGQTRYPKTRLLSHRNTQTKSAESDGTYSARWLRSLNSPVVMTILDTTDDLAECERLEIYYIAKLKSEGHRLTNCQLGGCAMTPEALAKLSAIRKGRTLSPDHRAKLSIAQLGHPVSPSARAKLSTALRGRNRPDISAAKRGHGTSPETREKIRASLTGKRLTPQHRANVSAALIGRTMSPVTRAKISAWRLGRTRQPDGKLTYTPVPQTTDAAPETKTPAAPGAP